MNGSIIMVAAVPSPHYRADPPAADLPDLGELRVGGMRHRVVHEPREVGMRDEHTERVEDYGRSMLSGALRVDQIAELMSLRSVAMTPRTRPCRGALRVIIGVPMLNEA